MTMKQDAEKIKQAAFNDFMKTILADTETKDIISNLIKNVATEQMNSPIVAGIAPAPPRPDVIKTTYEGNFKFSVKHSHEEPRRRLYSPHPSPEQMRADIKRIIRRPIVRTSATAEELETFLREDDFYVKEMSRNPDGTIFFVGISESWTDEPAAGTAFTPPPPEPLTIDEIEFLDK